MRHEIDVQKVVHGARFSRFHGLILFWCVLILVLDGYDLAVVGAALPSIMKDMGVNAAKAGFMASSALFGMMFGAIYLGTLADKIGRPVSLCACIGLFSAFTAAAGLTHDPVSFSITRFLAGLGIGGVLPIVTAQMGEFAPRAIRARLVTIVFAGYSIGGILVALTGKQMIESYGWQSVFFLAATPVLLIPFILMTMPDSLAFLVRNNRAAKLEATIRKIAPDVRLQPGDRFVMPQQTMSSTPVASLFRDGRGFSTVMIWIAFFMGLFMVYALSSWLTKLMAMSGYSLGSALTFVLVFNVGAVAGAIGGGWLGDKYNIKYVLVAFYATGAVSLALMGYTRSAELLFPIVFVVGGSTLGTQLLAYAYAGEFYPAVIRSTGVGFASGVGRLGAIAAPLLIGLLVTMHLPLEQNFLAIALAGVLGTLAVMMIDHRRSAVSRHDVDVAPARVDATSSASS
ncbi:MULTISPECIES: MFS transporter [unclassified Burkholderia]|uniref:MFS transporter n=1 Tax=unclassified Burkholderia TaxID=2613784 RepID=UPI0021500E1B|nr:MULTISPECIES: aromatic acid/H+ symport family MFS transporter [unclassified Burkholderia]MCR4471564.1 aromatic acid/H+ symport family MFS transporter [Burkholderia sp. SCN-KJ]